jgi:hypothetical protein
MNSSYSFLDQSGSDSGPSDFPTKDEPRATNEYFSLSRPQFENPPGAMFPSLEQNTSVMSGSGSKPSGYFTSLEPSPFHGAQNPPIQGPTPNVPNGPNPGQVAQYLYQENQKLRQQAMTLANYVQQQQKINGDNQNHKKVIRTLVIVLVILFLVVLVCLVFLCKKKTLA